MGSGQSLPPCPEGYEGPPSEYACDTVPKTVPCPGCTPINKILDEEGFIGIFGSLPGDEPYWLAAVGVAIIVALLMMMEVPPRLKNKGRPFNWFNYPTDRSTPTSKQR
jgi:hypothetical protein